MATVNPSRPGRPALPAGLKRGFHALGVRNYRLFWSGQLVSQIGSWMQTTAQAWLVLQLTQSPFAIGFVTTLQFLPFMLLSLFGGLIADRVSKRRMLLVTQVAGALQAGMFATLVATGAIQLWHVYVLATLQGIINAVDNPVRQAIVVELVGRDNLVNAVALNSMQFNTARILGPALAGLIIAQLGIAPALGINTISFVAAIVGLVLMDPSKFFAVPGRKPGPALQQLSEGLSYSWRTPAVLLVLIVVAMVGTFGYNFNTVLPLLAGFVLRTDAAGFGALSAAFGVGSLVGAVATAYAGQVTVRRLLIASGCFSVLLAAVAVTPVLWLALVLLVALGFAGVNFGTTANSLVQLNVPDELRGRVMSLYILLFIGSTPIGAFLIGSLSSIIGVPVTLVLSAALCALGVAGGWLYHNKLRSVSSEL